MMKMLSTWMILAVAVHADASWKSMENTTTENFDILETNLHDCNLSKEEVTTCTVNPEVFGQSLGNVSKHNPKKLHIILRNYVKFTWQGLKTPILDLSNLTLMSEYLEEVKISIKYKDNTQLYFFNLSHGSLQSMQKLTSVNLNVPTSEEVTTFFTKDILSVPNITILNLAGSRGIDPFVLRPIIQKYNDKLVEIDLQHVQAKGRYSSEKYKKYFSVLNILDFFCRPANTSDSSLYPIVYNNVEYLDLSRNSFDRIDPGLSIAFPYLRILDISYNYFTDISTTSFFLECIWHEYLEEFYSNYQGKGYLEEDKIPPEQVKTVKVYQEVSQGLGSASKLLKCINVTLHASRFNLGDFLCGLYECFGYVGVQVLPKCQDFTKCVVMEMFKYYNHNITTLPLSVVNDNGFWKMLVCITLRCMWPILLHEFPCERFPFLIRFLSDSHSTCTTGLQFPFGQNLRILSLRNLGLQQGTNTLPPIGNDIVICIEQNNLTKITASHNQQTFTATNLKTDFENINVTGVESVTTLDLGYDYLDISLTKIKTSFPNLNNLTFRNNNIKIDRNETLCSRNHSLTKVNLRENSLHSLPEDFIVNCSKLEYLNLKYNYFKSDFFLRLPKTEKKLVINLKWNDIEYLPQKFTDELDQNNAAVLLKGNNFNCDCSKISYKLVNWFHKHGKQKVLDYESVHCNNRGGGRSYIKNYKIHWMDCNKNVEITIFSILSGCIVIVVVLTWTYRLRIRYKLFKLKQFLRRCCTKSTTPDRSSWDYDVFVAFCDVDRYWVIGAMMPELENKHGFRLCVYLRDFLLGGSIADTVVDYMSRSREIIIVVSEEFIGREWCIFEVNEALRQTAQRRTQPLVIKLGEIDLMKENVPNVMSHLLGTYIYLEWPEKPEAHRLFWERLVDNLYHQRDTCWPKRQVGFNPDADIIDDLSVRSQAGSNPDVDIISDVIVRSGAGSITDEDDLLLNL